MNTQTLDNIAATFAPKAPERVSAEEQLTALTTALVARMIDRAHEFNVDVLAFAPPSPPHCLPAVRLKPVMDAFDEEDREFAIAVADGDLLEAADALIDGIYFRLGRLVEMGVPPGPVFDEVHRANMAKVPGDLAKRPGWEGRDAVKPEGWRAPDHSWLLGMTDRRRATDDELGALRARLEEAEERAMKAERLRDDAMQELAESRSIRENMRKRIDGLLAEAREERPADGLEAMSPVWLRLQRLRTEKGQDYNNVPGGRDAYFPFGHASYAHMVNTKTLRMLSLIGAMQAGKKPNFEGLLDTVEDLVNYATYYAEAMRDGRLNKDTL